MHELRDTSKNQAHNHIQTYRKIVQYLFLAVTLLIGVQFGIFVSQLEKGILPSMTRPPGIEAFLPISSLISFKYWLLTGIFNPIHPSGLIIFLVILSTAILLKRGFCSWVCPIGLLTEYLNRLHRFIFRKDIRIPRWLDYPLRSLKYLLLFFFLWAIMIQMNVRDLDHFIYSPYNMVADIKMLHFFTNISALAFWVLVALLVLSILVRNFWCRYLCPYGALLGGLSFVSIFKIHRNEDTCTQCHQCTRACPVDIKVHKTTGVISDECHACLKCVAVCPEKDTLYISSAKRSGILKPLLYAAIICLIFMGGSIIGRLTGHWQTSISSYEYSFHTAHLQTPFYQHNRGQVPVYNKDAWMQMMAEIKKSKSAWRNKQKPKVK